MTDQPTSSNLPLVTFANVAQTLVLDWQMDPDVASRLGQVWSVMRSAPTTSTTSERIVLYEIVRRIAFVTATIRPVLERIPYNWSPSSDNVRLVAALNRLLDHSAEPDLSLQALAKQIGLSGSRLGHLISETTNVGFRTHLQGVRLLHTVRLLSTTTIPCKEIAWRVGFSSTSALDHVFRGWLKTSPREFRKLCFKSRIVHQST